MMRIRLFESRDWRALPRLAHEAVPFAPEDNREWYRKRRRFDDRRYVRHHFVAEDDVGQVIGYAAIEQQPSNRERFRLFVVTTPDRLDGEVGHGLYGRLEQALQEEGARYAWAREHHQDEASQHFFRQRGFDQTSLMWELLYTVADEDSPLAGAVQRAEAAGFSVTTMAQERTRQDDVVQRLHPVFNAVHADEMPHTQFVPVPYGRFSQWLAQPGVRADALFIVLQGDRYVGWSLVTPVPGKPERLLLQFIGVQWPYQESEATTALGAQTLDYAKQEGAREVVAYALDHQPARLALAESLGFERRYGFVTLEKRL